MKSKMKSINEDNNTNNNVNTITNLNDIARSIDNDTQHILEMKPQIWQSMKIEFNK